jgi:anti-anti-sigma regulatory factor
LVAASDAPLEPARPVLVVRGAIRGRDVAQLCRALAAFRGAGPIVCDVSAVAPVDVSTLDALARLALASRRRGRGLVLRNAAPELRDLVALAGLGEVLPCPTPSRLESGRQAEEREEAGGVEEERDPADPAV